MHTTLTVFLCCNCYLTKYIIILEPLNIYLMLFKTVKWRILLLWNRETFGLTSLKNNRDSFCFYFFCLLFADRRKHLSNRKHTQQNVCCLFCLFLRLPRSWMKKRGAGGFGEKQIGSINFAQICPDSSRNICVPARRKREGERKVAGSILAFFLRLWADSNSAGIM